MVLGFPGTSRSFIKGMFTLRTGVTIPCTFLRLDMELLVLRADVMADLAIHPIQETTDSISITSALNFLAKVG